ncbi:ATP-binding cassette domain-containing protein, partial [Candidatus Bathyarchaeota archaeon]
MSQLEIKDLHASIEGKEILKGVDFQVKQGEIHAIMGPNGSGKSTLASTIMGHPKYKVTKGDISFDGQTLLNLAPDARARKGVFLAFQYPYEVP